jgi:hypothetical protein
MTVENTLYRKSSIIDDLLPELSASRYAIRVLEPFVTRETLVVVYCAYCHSTVNYDIIFWSNFPYSINIFKLQNR